MDGAAPKAGLPAAFKKRPPAALKRNADQLSANSAGSQDAAGSQFAGGAPGGFSWDSFVNNSSQGDSSGQIVGQTPDPTQGMSQGGVNMMQNMMQMMMMMQGMQQMQQAQPVQPAPAPSPAAPEDPMQNMMQSMFQMGQMQALQAAMQKAKQKKPAMQASLPAAGADGGMDMSAYMAMMGGAQGQGAAPSETQEAYACQATQDAFAATQQAIYDQQIQFFEQVRAQRTQTEKAERGGLSRFKDDYRAYQLCKNNQINICSNGQRCEFAHCYEELHPASPDMPQDEAIIASALSTLKNSQPKEESEPKIQLRKKRDLCRKFKESGHCSRGGACPNAHGEAEIGKTAFVLYDKVKLEMCKAYRDGKCAYGASCIYAHGDHEIGQKRREWDAPPIKKRRGHQSLEDWRYEILRDPDAPAFP